MTRTLVFEIPGDDDSVQQVLVDLWPDDTVSIATRPDRYSVWGPPFSPIRDEDSEETWTAAVTLTAQQILDKVLGNEERRA